ncbi:MAG: dihydrodipicolinate synthase family protein [Betaproteobacteria bacterium]|jgi:4-hydroxy-tetrahydrodipicolinate synthase
MALILRGVMQSPVTPLKEDFSLDIPTYEKLVDFHVRTGATAISWPHHKAESHNLTKEERMRGAEATVNAVHGRVPVSIHVSSMSVEDAMELAQHAQKIGADAIIAITPYFWAPSPDAIYDYFVRLGTSIDLPMIAYNSPAYLEGVEFTAELIERLLLRLPNLIAMKEASFNSEKFMEISRVALKVRPSFSIVAGVEFLAPSVPLGCVGSYSSAGAICPNLCTALFDACINGRSAEARELQFKLAALWDLFRDQYPSSLKGGMVAMGRYVGPTRPPLPTASKEREAFIAKKLEELGILDTEPHGW